MDEEANNKPDGNNIAKERKRRSAFGGTYKEELVAMIEAKKVLAANRKVEKMSMWNELKFLEDGEWKAKCNWCQKILTVGLRNGTKHLRLHLDICTLKKLKTKGGKTLSQSSLKVSATEDGEVSMETYTFDQEVARRELGNMLMLHEYPLSIVYHAGFRKFVSALQPLLKVHTRSTIRYTLL